MAIMKTRAETTISRPASEIWARIGNFADISWIPGTEPHNCRMDGNIRTVTKDAWDFNLVQRLIEHDDTRHTYSYDLPHDVSFEALAGPGKIAKVLNGTLKVTETGPSQSTVTWDLETEDFIFKGASVEYQHALDTLKADMEG
ncbi:Polyketide cyclase / dehydrase and lipid transport [Novosphingobium sp. CF614]|uniref:SRPBCC family protein n=1 Tax=Novosphingobium sp. CF614 TaxID=1884364 RepID=UPI0008E03286|nr:SRPBCC family protein [Novosphingobium sp. CF614]SFF77119.1 Polyketide cyclase / dehydrase and lipid transport [Novosphingobium sp. CF614]